LGRPPIKAQRTTGKKHRIKRWERSLAPHRYSVPGLGGSVQPRPIGKLFLEQNVYTLLDEQVAL
jgi:hypothetical protein